MAKALEIDGDGDTKVEVCLSENKNICVRVFSVKKPGLISSGFVDPLSEKVHMKVMILAGAIAEHQCKNYGDQHDPDGVAQAAGKAFELMVRKVQHGMQEQKR